MEQMDALERQLASVVQGAMRPPRPVDAAAIVRSATGGAPTGRWSGITPRFRGDRSAPTEGGFSMFSALKFVAASIIVALFGGFLLTGVLSTPQGDQTAPAAMTKSPSPMTTEELLSGMVTEEVEPGVFRIVHDGVRDLTSAEYWGVFAGQDGSIWLDHAGYPSRLGVAETHDWPLGGSKRLRDIEVAHDGTVWVVTVKDDESPLRTESIDRDESILRSFDGETWTTHRVMDERHVVDDVVLASDGVVWVVMQDGTLGYLDADGSTWQTIETPTNRAGQGDFNSEVDELGFIATESDLWARSFGGVWHYADGAWEHIPYGDPDTGALPDGVFWGVGEGTDDDWVLYRHDGTGWRQWSLREYDMLPGGWVIGPYAVAPDGSFWAGWSMRDREEPQTPPRYECVSRFDGRTWVRYLSGRCVVRLPGLAQMDIAPDGSVWVLSLGGEDPDAEPSPDLPESGLYVITPEAVAASE